MQQKRLTRATLVLTSFFMLMVLVLPSMTVYAGDINEAEQRVINYYNKTFYYDGKAYVASEDAKAKAYAKLSQDGMNMNDAQADNMIMQISANVGTGVKRGYLVEVDRPDENGGGTADDTEGADTETESEIENNGAEGNTDPSSNTIDNHTDDSAESGQQGTNGQLTEEDKNSGSGTSSAKDGRKRVDTRKLIRELEKREQKDGDELALYDNEGKKLKAADLESGSKDGPITIKDYTAGMLRVMEADGTLLYETSLPIRNTGKKTDPWYIFPLVLLAGFLLIGLFCYIKPTVDIHWALGGAALAAITIIGVAVGGWNTISSYTDQWRHAWITNAPEFKYQEEKKPETKPEMAKAVLHDQYGVIRCVNVDLNVPLYYGDGDDELDKGAGIFPGYTLPGETGTTLIGGHDGTFFAPLAHISQGDVLEVDTISGTRYYSVVNTAVAKASDESKYSLQRDEDSLILYTCYPFGKTTADRSRRFFVYAEKMETGE